MKFTDANTSIQIIESSIRKGCWKVWVKGPVGSGYLRLGFAWKTRAGAVNAAKKAYPLVSVH